MMRAMNWKGHGLGKDELGREEPIPQGKAQPQKKAEPEEPRRRIRFVREKAPDPPRPTDDHAHVAIVSSKKRPAQNKDKLRAVTGEDGTTHYGYPCKDGLDECELSTKGVPTKTGATLEIDLAHIREIVRWADKPVGVAELFFPHPKEWRLGAIDKDLDKIVIKDITTAMLLAIQIAPSCIAAWAQRIGELPANVGARYNTRLLTPRDWGSHFKNILHRALLTHSIDGSGAPCRCCGFARENIQHLATCEKLGKVFKTFRKLTGCPVPTNEKEWERFALFAITPSGPPLEEGWINLHLLLWKHIIAHMVRIEIDGEKYNPDHIWAPAWVRLRDKASALQEKVWAAVRLEDSRGTPPKCKKSRGTPLQPIAKISEYGMLEWDEDLKSQLEKLAKPRSAKGKGAKS